MILIIKTLHDEKRAKDAKIYKEGQEGFSRGGRKETTGLNEDTEARSMKNQSTKEDAAWHR